MTVVNAQANVHDGLLCPWSNMNIEKISRLAPKSLWSWLTRCPWKNVPCSSNNAFAFFLRCAILFAVSTTELSMKEVRFASIRSCFIQRGSPCHSPTKVQVSLVTQTSVSKHDSHLRKTRPQKNMSSPIALAQKWRIFDARINDDREGKASFDLMRRSIKFGLSWS